MNKHTRFPVFPRIASRVFSLSAGLVLASVSVSTGQTPWGMSSSASSYRNHEEWFPVMAEAGVTTVRLFPGWSSFESPRGNWKWEQGDRLVRNAEAHGIEINAILMGSIPGSKKIHAFPMADLDGWGNYVEKVVGRYSPRVRYWEVWNEGNGGFNDDHHTTRDYARLAMTTYASAKRADPRAQVGLSVASFDPAYIQRAMETMAEEGMPGAFDFLCIHPYEIADGLAGTDGEIAFLWMSRMLRDMLREIAPAKADAEIWITEIGRRIEQRGGHDVTEREAARAFLKIYTMAMAQGIARTQWFEARDPYGEPPGFGLLTREGQPRPAFTALKTLTGQLGAQPKYLGWLALGEGGRGYGFVFEGKAGAVLVAWMPVGVADASIALESEVSVVNPQTGDSLRLAAGAPLVLTENPLLVSGLPPSVVRAARANKAKNFPWGGDFSDADTVTCSPGSPEESAGIFLTSREPMPTLRYPDGSTGILLGANQGVNFFVHPSFEDLQTRDYYVRVTVRRIMPGNVGMNLFYEIADSQGRVPYNNRGIWFGLSPADGWQTHTWHIEDACFAKMWGNDISFRPELSVPFVMGKVEVSTKPFE